MKVTKLRLKEIIKEEILETLKEAQVSQRDFKNMNFRDALRVSGGDDKDLRKSIADFITKGGEDRQEVLANAIGKYKYSDPYLVNLARTLLARGLAKSSAAKRIQVAKSVDTSVNENIEWLNTLEESIIRN